MNNNWVPSDPLLTNKLDLAGMSAYFNDQIKSA